MVTRRWINRQIHYKCFTESLKPFNPSFPFWSPWKYQKHQKRWFSDVFMGLTGNTGNKWANKTSEACYFQTLITWYWQYIPSIFKNFHLKIDCRNITFSRLISTKRSNIGSTAVPLKCELFLVDFRRQGIIFLQKNWHLPRHIYRLVNPHLDQLAR